MLKYLILLYYLILLVVIKEIIKPKSNNGDYKIFYWDFEVFSNYMKKRDKVYEILLNTFLLRKNKMHPPTQNALGTYPKVLYFNKFYFT